MKISALERKNQGEFIYRYTEDEQLPVPVVFVQYKKNAKSVIFVISFKFAIQLRNWKRWKNRKWRHNGDWKFFLYNSL